MQTSSVLVSSCFLSGFSRLGIMSFPSSNNGDNDAWLMKIDLKREEPMRVNKDEM